MQYNTDMDYDVQFYFKSKVALFAFVITLGATLNLSLSSMDSTNNNLVSIINALCSSYPAPDDYFQIVACLFFLCFLANVNFKHGVTVTFLRVAISLFFGFAMVAGFALEETGSLMVLAANAVQLIKTAWAFISWSIIAFMLINVGVNWLDAYLFTRGERIGTRCKGRANQFERFIGFIFNKHSFVAPAVFMVIAWLPVLIGNAPGLFMGDTPAQLSMWYGLPSGRSQAVHLIDEAVTLTTHYPLLHTALFGVCVQLGDAAGNINLGIMFYTLFQYICVVVAIAYGHSVAYKLGTPLSMRIACLALFVFVPWFAGYAVLITRDTLFAAALFVFLVELLAFSHAAGRGVLIVSAILVSLLRNGGPLFALGGLLALLGITCFRKISVKIHAPILAVVLVCSVNILITMVLCPLLHITPTTKLEMLSVPVQQVARYARDYPLDITQAEKVAVDTILVYDGLSERYNPNNADPVKDYAAKHRHDISNGEWRSFFAAWKSMGARHPGCFVVATMENYYGYFYIGSKAPSYYTAAWSAKKMELISDKLSTDIHHSRAMPSKVLRGANTTYVEIWRYTPIFQLLMTSAFWYWALILLTGYAWHRKWHFALPVLVTVWLFALVTLIGPVNGLVYNRYVFPIAFVLPLMFSTCVGLERKDL